MDNGQKKYAFLGGMTVEEWFNSPAGQASLEDLRKLMEREKRFKERFAKRVKSLTLEEQNRWMTRITTSQKDYRLEAWVGEFISENGVKIGEDEYGYIFQYNNWKAIQILDCYRFEYTEEVPHEYGDDIFYVLNITFLPDSSNLSINFPLKNYGSKYFKAWKDANTFGTWFVKSVLNVYKTQADYSIEKIKLTTVEEAKSELQNVIGSTK